jgi:hypothetical protein
LILLDHNITEDQVELLKRWRIHCRQIGFEVGRPEWDDQQDILRCLHSTRGVTMFTRDLGFFRQKLCHRNYCLVILNLPVLETARYVQRLLGHRELKTKAKRAGKIIRLSPHKISVWELGQHRQRSLNW